jgi:bacterioferritin
MAKGVLCSVSHSIALSTDAPQLPSASSSQALYQLKLETQAAAPLVGFVIGTPFARSYLVTGVSNRAFRKNAMVNKQATKTAADGTAPISREQLIALLNEDLARKYQAIIAYVVYSPVLKGAQYMSIAGELEKHARQELEHALVIAKQIDYLGGMPNVPPKQVRTSENSEEMLRFDPANENETVRNYRERVRQCEALGEYAMAEHIREILVNEQEHQIDLATALGKDVAEVVPPQDQAQAGWQTDFGAGVPPRSCERGYLAAFARTRGAQPAFIPVWRASHLRCAPGRRLA